MFDDEGASTVAAPIFTSFLFPSKLSSSRPDLDFRLLSSSSELVDEEIKIDDQAQPYLGVETESTPKQVNEDTTQPDFPNRQ